MTVILIWYAGCIMKDIYDTMVASMRWHMQILFE